MYLLLDTIHGSADMIASTNLVNLLSSADVVSGLFKSGSVAGVYVVKRSPTLFSDVVL